MENRDKFENFPRTLNYKCNADVKSVPRGGRWCGVYRNHRTARRRRAPAAPPARSCGRGLLGRVLLRGRAAPPTPLATAPHLLQDSAMPPPPPLQPRASQSHSLRCRLLVERPRCRGDAGRRPELPRALHLVAGLPLTAAAAGFLLSLQPGNLPLPDPGIRRACCSLRRTGNVAARQRTLGSALCRRRRRRTTALCRCSGP